MGLLLKKLQLNILNKLPRRTQFFTAMSSKHKHIYVADTQFFFAACPWGDQPMPASKDYFVTGEDAVQTTGPESSTELSGASDLVFTINLFSKSRAKWCVLKLGTSFSMV